MMRRDNQNPSQASPLSLLVDAAEAKDTSGDGGNSLHHHHHQLQGNIGRVTMPNVMGDSSLGSRRSAHTEPSIASQHQLGMSAEDQLVLRQQMLLRMGALPGGGGGGYPAALRGLTEADLFRQQLLAMQQTPQQPAYGGFHQDSGIPPHLHHLLAQQGHIAPQHYADLFQSGRATAQSRMGLEGMLGGHPSMGGGGGGGASQLDNRLLQLQLLEQRKRLEALGVNRQEISLPPAEQIPAAPVATASGEIPVVSGRVNETAPDKPKNETLASSQRAQNGSSKKQKLSHFDSKDRSGVLLHSNEEKQPNEAKQRAHGRLPKQGIGSVRGGSAPVSSPHAENLVTESSNGKSSSISKVASNASLAEQILMVLMDRKADQLLDGDAIRDPDGAVGEVENRRPRWEALLGKRPHSKDQEALICWVQEALAVSDLHSPLFGTNEAGGFEQSTTEELTDSGEPDDSSSSDEQPPEDNFKDDASTSSESFVLADMKVDQKNRYTK